MHTHTQRPAHLWLRSNLNLYWSCLGVVQRTRIVSLYNRPIRTHVNVIVLPRTQRVLSNFIRYTSEEGYSHCRLSDRSRTYHVIQRSKRTLECPNSSQLYKRPLPRRNTGGQTIDLNINYTSVAYAACALRRTTTHGTLNMNESLARTSASTNTNTYTIAYIIFGLALTYTYRIYKHYFGLALYL